MTRQWPPWKRWGSTSTPPERQREAGSSARCLPGDTVTVGASVEVRFTADIGSESGLDTGQDGNWVQTDEEEDTTTGDG